MCARVIYAMPLALDAVAVVGARRGQVNLFFSFYDFVSLCIFVTWTNNARQTDLVLLMSNSVLLQTLVVFFDFSAFLFCSLRRPFWTFSAK